MPYGDFMDLPIRTNPDKLLHDKAFNIAKIPKHDEYQRGFASLVYKFLDKNSSGANASSGAVKRTRSDILATQIKSAVKS